MPQIILPPNLESHWLWQDKQHLIWWIELLILATDTPLIKISTRALAQKWNTTHWKAREYLKNLSKNNLINLKNDAKTITIQIQNINKWIYTENTDSAQQTAQIRKSISNNYEDIPHSKPHNNKKTPQKTQKNNNSAQQTAQINIKESDSYEDTPHSIPHNATNSAQQTAQITNSVTDSYEDTPHSIPHSPKKETEKEKENTLSPTPPLIKEKEKEKEKVLGPFSDENGSSETGFLTPQSEPLTNELFQEPIETIDVKYFVTLWNHKVLTNKSTIPQIRNIAGKRLNALKARLREYNLTTISEMFQKATTSDFLNGKNNRGWIANIDWALLPTNFPKIIEGNYDNRNTQPTTKTTPDRRRGYEVTATSPDDFLDDF